MKRESVTEEWNGRIIDMWDKPADFSSSKGAGVPIIDLWTTVYKTQSNDSADTHKDEKKNPL
jgi:hypothetical protein